MLVKVVQQGDGLALILDRLLLEQLHITITPGTSLNITTRGEMLIISPIQDEERRAAIATSIAEMDKQYSEVFQRLAE